MRLAAWICRYSTSWWHIWYYSLFIEVVILWFVNDCDLHSFYFSIEKDNRLDWVHGVENNQYCSIISETLINISINTESLLRLRMFFLSIFWMKKRHHRRMKLLHSNLCTTKKTKTNYFCFIDYAFVSYSIGIAMSSMLFAQFSYFFFPCDLKIKS